MSAKDWVSRANKRLKGCGVTLGLQGKSNCLYLRGMFPGKPWEGKSLEVKQRRIALKLRALSQDAVKQAETIAREVALDLNKGAFDWSFFSDVEIPLEAQYTIAHFVADLRRDKLESGKVTEYTWQNNYQRLINTLPLDKPPSEDLLMAWIIEQDPNGSTARCKYLSLASAICTYANIPSNRLTQLKKENSSKPINPRLLPSDAEIVETWEKVTARNEQWGWVYAMLATYGLRPHELFRLDLSGSPDIKVLQNTKTGERLVPPIPFDWPKKFNLTSKLNIPSTLKYDDDTPSFRLGIKIGKGFSHLGLSSPYNLRHCYARRCLEQGLPSDVGSALMGHSRTVHENIYRHWIKSTTYLEVAKRITERK